MALLAAPGVSVSEERRREYSPVPLRTVPVGVILGYDS